MFSRGDRLKLFVKHVDLERDRVGLTCREPEGLFKPEDPLDEDYQKCYHRKMLRKIQKEEYLKEERDFERLVQKYGGDI